MICCRFKMFARHQLMAQKKPHLFICYFLLFFLSVLISLVWWFSKTWLLDVPEGPKLLILFLDYPLSNSYFHKIKQNKKIKHLTLLLLIQCSNKYARSSLTFRRCRKNKSSGQWYKLKWDEKSGLFPSPTLANENLSKWFWTLLFRHLFYFYSFLICLF